MKNFLSVIIPVYNAAPYLRRCLDSVLKQNFRDYEVIIVDDGSTDDSLQICEEYSLKDARFSVFHKANGGVSCARNYGLERAHGELVCWIDADDFANPNYLSDLLDAYTFDTDLVIESLIRKSATEESQVSGVAPGVYDLSNPSDQNSFFASICIDHLGVSVSKLFKLSIIRKYGIQYSADIRLAEDLDFLFRYLVHCRKVVVCEHANYYYMLRAGSESARVYPFDTELKGWHQITFSCAVLSQKFPLLALDSVTGYTRSAYLLRVLISCYHLDILRSKRFDFFHSISSADLALYHSYGPRQTCFLQVMGCLITHRFFPLFDGLMLFVYRFCYKL